MVDSRTMHRLTEHAKRAGARLVLVGDHKQLQAVGAGGLFRHLAERDSARISEIRRQKDEWARDAVREFSRGDAAAAIQRFLDRDLVHVADDQQGAITQAVDRWAHHADEVGASEALLMASTNAEVQLLNSAARARMRGDGRLAGDDITIQTHDRTGKPTGKLAIAVGDRLLTKKNDRATGLKNGDLMAVEAVRFIPTGAGVEFDVRLDRTGERITIDPGEYSCFRHGYAVTTHAAQGATVDRAVALAGGSMTSRESTYVQMSRMRETAEIIATRQQLRDVAEQVAPTESMVELCESIAEERAVELPDDYKETFASARDWLNEYAYEIRGDEAAEKDDRLVELRDLVRAMSTSRQKETTLDYEVAASAEAADALSAEIRARALAAANAAASATPIPTADDKTLRGVAGLALVWGDDGGDGMYQEAYDELRRALRESAPELSGAGVDKLADDTLLLNVAAANAEFSSERAAIEELIADARERVKQHEPLTGAERYEIAVAVLGREHVDAELAPYATTDAAVAAEQEDEMVMTMTMEED